MEFKLIFDEDESSEKGNSSYYEPDNRVKNTDIDGNNVGFGIYPSKEGSTSMEKIFKDNQEFTPYDILAATQKYFIDGEEDNIIPILNFLCNKLQEIPESASSEHTDIKNTDSAWFNQYLSLPNITLSLIQIWNSTNQRNSSEGIMKLIIPCIANSITLYHRNLQTKFVDEAINNILEKNAKLVLRNIFKSENLTSCTLFMLQKVADMGPLYCKQIFTSFDFDRWNIFGILKRNSGQDRPSLVNFALSLHKNSESLIKEQILNSRISLSNYFKGLSNDDYPILLRFFDVIENDIIADPLVSKKTILHLLNNTNLNYVLNLFEKGEEIASLTFNFLEAISCYPGKGVCFPSNGWFPPKGSSINITKISSSRNLNNIILLNFVKQMRPTDVNLQEKLFLKILRSSPELVHHYFSSCNLRLEPRLEKSWIKNIDLVKSIITLPIPKFESIGFQFSRQSTVKIPLPPNSNVILDNILPKPLSKIFLSRGLQNENFLIKFITGSIISVSFEKYSQVLSWINDMISLFPGMPYESDILLDEQDKHFKTEFGNKAKFLECYQQWSKLRVQVEAGFRERLPDFQVLISVSGAILSPSKDTSIHLDYAEETSFSECDNHEALKLVILRLIRNFYRSFRSVAMNAKFDVGKLVIQIMQYLENINNLDENESMIVENVFDLMHLASDDIKWFLKLPNSRYSLLSSLIQTANGATGELFLRLRNDVLPSLIKSIPFMSDFAVECELWLRAMINNDNDKSDLNLLDFFDECMLECRKKYLNLCSKYEKHSDESKQDDLKSLDEFCRDVSLLSQCILEKLPYIYLKKGVKAQSLFKSLNLIFAKIVLFARKSSNFLSDMVKKCWIQMMNISTTDNLSITLEKSLSVVKKCLSERVQLPDPRLYFVLFIAYIFPDDFSSELGLNREYLGGMKNAMPDLILIKNIKSELSVEYICNVANSLSEESLDLRFSCISFLLHHLIIEKAKGRRQNYVILLEKLKMIITRSQSTHLSEERLNFILNDELFLKMFENDDVILNFLNDVILENSQAFYLPCWPWIIQEITKDPYKNIKILLNQIERLEKNKLVDIMNNLLSMKPRSGFEKIFSAVRSKSCAAIEEYIYQVHENTSDPFIRQELLIRLLKIIPDKWKIFDLSKSSEIIQAINCCSDEEKISFLETVALEMKCFPKSLMAVLESLFAEDQSCIEKKLDLLLKFHSKLRIEKSTISIISYFLKSTINACLASSNQSKFSNNLLQVFEKFLQKHEMISSEIFDKNFLDSICLSINSISVKDSATLEIMIFLSSFFYNKGFDIDLIDQKIHQSFLNLFEKHEIIVPITKYAEYTLLSPSTTSIELWRLLNLLERYPNDPCTYDYVRYTQLKGHYSSDKLQILFDHSLKNFETLVETSTAIDDFEKEFSQDIETKGLDKIPPYDDKEEVKASALRLVVCIMNASSSLKSRGFINLQPVQIDVLIEAYTRSSKESDRLLLLIFWFIEKHTNNNLYFDLFDGFLDYQALQNNLNPRFVMASIFYADMDIPVEPSAEYIERKILRYVPESKSKKVPYNCHIFWMMWLFHWLHKCLPPLDEWSAEWDTEVPRFDLLFSYNIIGMVLISTSSEQISTRKYAYELLHQVITVFDHAGVLNELEEFYENKRRKVDNSYQGYVDNYEKTDQFYSDNQVSKKRMRNHPNARTLPYQLMKKVGDARQIYLLLNCLRNSLTIYSLNSCPPLEFPRIPTFSSLLAAQAIPILSTPSSSLYPIVNRFLLQRPTFELDDVPLFYNLIHSRDADNWKKELHWILRLLFYGLKTVEDEKISRKRFVLEIIVSNSVFFDPAARLLATEILHKIMKLRKKSSSSSNLEDSHLIALWKRDSIIDSEKKTAETEHEPHQNNFRCILKLLNNLD